MFSKCLFAAIAATFLLLGAIPALCSDRQETVQLVNGEISVPLPPFTLSDTAGLYRPCAVGMDDRNSDLCAQWKAADAAKSSYIIGSLTLIAAGLAAWYAKKAAEETRRGADAAHRSVLETRRIGQAQVRAYVFPYIKDINFEPEKFLKAKIEWKNSGQSPAGNCLAFVGWLPLTRNEAQNRLEYIRLRKYEKSASDEHNTTSLAPGASLHIDLPTIEDDLLKKFMNGQIELVASGYILYRDAFRRRRFTRFCEKLVLSEIDGKKKAFFQPLPIGNHHY